MPYPWEDYRAGTRVVAFPGYATVYEDFDFETFSAAGYAFDALKNRWGSLPGLSDQNRGLTAVGARNYVEHPTFRILSLAWNLKDGRGPRWWRPPEISDLFPATRRGDLCDVAELHQHVRNGGKLEAFNVGFELTVWNCYCVPKLGWPPLHIAQLHCAMAKARASAYPGKLEDLGDVLRLNERKDPAGEKLIKLLTVPRNPTPERTKSGGRGKPRIVIAAANNNLRWTPITAGEEFERFYEYNKQDIRTEAEASMRLPDLSPHELNVWRFDLLNNQRGMQVDRFGIDNCIAIAEQCFTKGNAELQRLTSYYCSNTSEVKRILEWMRHRGVVLPDLDEETIEEHITRTDYPLDVQRVIRLRQMLAFGSVKKLWAFRSHSTPQGRLHDQYVYHGAHTGLWNGRAVQPANLYKGMFSKPEQAERALAVIATRSLEAVEREYPGVDALEVVASCLRSLIIASPGCRLMSADFTAIQAVATSAMAGEEWRLEIFRTHGKIYEAMASRLTGKPLQYYLDYKIQNGKHHDDRQLGKLAVLSADFGAWISGWKRFGAEKYGDDAYIKQLILRTRDAQPMIGEFWGGQTRNKFNKGGEERAELYGLEGAAISAILEPGRAFAYRNVAYQVYEDTLYCKPPSGGFIRYHAPRLAKSHRDYAREWELEMSYEGWNSSATKAKQGWSRMKLYGGVCTQNVISHECREVQALALMRLERRDYPVVMHTHDENVADVPVGFGSKKEYIEIVRELPGFCVDLNGKPWPIKVPDAWEAQRYGKWED